MLSSLGQGKEKERAATIEWACKLLLDQSQAQKRATILDALKVCIDIKSD